MGANCLSSYLDQIHQINTQSTGDSNDISVQFQLFVTSGGDDQSIGLALFSFQFDVNLVSRSIFSF